MYAVAADASNCEGVSQFTTSDCLVFSSVTFKVRSNGEYGEKTYLWPGSQRNGNVDQRRVFPAAVSTRRVCTPDVTLTVLNPKLKSRICPLETSRLSMRVTYVPQLPWSTATSGPGLGAAYLGNFGPVGAHPNDRQSATRTVPKPDKR